MIIKITKAQQEDAKELTSVSQAAFDDDVHYGAPQAGGPPGYRSASWHTRMILNCDVYKIVAENGHFDRLNFDKLSDRIIGGIIVYQKKAGHMELGRMFIHPDYQNQGIGAQAIRFLEETYPDAHLWTLDTPAWNTRNRHFYEKMGYTLTGAVGPGGVWYEKRIAVNTL